ncbi:MAG: 50S ribosomal protein L4 [Planctomycetes bacterium]|nr:50S ribosomal protein L4 [Planctomycetota bacterium]
MLAVPVFNIKGERLGQMEVDPMLLGGRVRPQLLKQAIVTFQDHQRLEAARRKGRGEVEGSTRKLYRQKGTGNARMGTIRTPIRRGGGRAFSKLGPRSFKTLPKKMRRLARDNAVLAKIQAEDVLIVDGLSCPQPKTKALATMFAALGAQRGCVLAVAAYDAAVHRSGRNIPNADVRVVTELNAYEILARPKLIFTRPAFELFTTGSEPAATG